jgi:hypothetical protein
LQEAGWSASGGQLTYLYDDTRPTVHVDTARRVQGVYERLRDLEGPDVRSARSAARHGFPPPWAWDGLDIDDPGVPVPDPGPVVDQVAVCRFLAGEDVPLTYEEKRAAARQAHAHGVSHASVQRRLHWSGQTMSRALQDAPPAPQVDGGCVERAS